MAAGSIKLTVQVGRFGSPQTNMPVVFNATLLSGTTAFSWVNFFDEMSDADRKKVKIWNSTKTVEYNAEIEPGYDFANDKCVYHVKAGDIDDGDIFYLDYDSSWAENTTYIGDTESTPAKAVWDSGFKLVQLMVDFSATQVADSTVNANYSTKKAANEPIEADWSFGKCQNFDGNDYLRVADSDDFYFGTGALVIEATLDFTTLPTSGNRVAICGQSNGVDTSWGLNLYNNSGTYQWEFFAYSLGYTVQEFRNAVSITTGIEYYIAVSRNAVNNFFMFQDGAQIGAPTSDSGAFPNVVSHLGIGEDGNGSSLITGKIGSFKITKGVYRSIDWIESQNYSLKDDMFAMEDVVAKVDTPDISPPSGAVPSGQLITLTSANADSIYWTDTGVNPTPVDNLYTVPFAITTDVTIKAYGVASGFDDSDVASESYTIEVPQAESPIFDPTGGTYSIDASIKLSSTTIGASFLYSTDGSYPSIPYTALIPNFNGTLKSIAQKTGYLDSDVTSDTYAITAPQVWDEFRDLGPDSFNFTEQPDVWGYLNNPRWTENTNPEDQHIPCGHWHKNPRPSGSVDEIVEVTPTGKLIAALEQRETPYIYLYAEDMYAIVKIDTTEDSPVVVDYLVVNDADYTLDANPPDLATPERGGYCMSKAFDKVWYLFRNTSNGDIKLVEIDVSGAVMSIIKTSIHYGVMVGEHFNDGCGNSDYCFFPTSVVTGRILKFDNDHTLTDKAFGYPTNSTAEAIASIALNPTLNEIVWLYNAPDFYVKAPYSDFNFNVRVTYSQQDGGADSNQWQNFIRYDEKFGTTFRQRIYNPTNGIGYYHSKWVMDAERQYIQTLSYMKQYLGGDVNYFYLLQMNVAGNAWRLHQMTTSQDTSGGGAVPETELNVTSYVTAFSANSTVSIYNEDSDKSFLIRYNDVDNRNYIASWDQSLSLVEDTKLDKFYKKILVDEPAFPYQNADNEPQIWAMPGETYDKKNNR